MLLEELFLTRIGCSTTVHGNRAFPKSLTKFGSYFADVLYLYIGNNPLIPDERVKWMRVGQEEGWLQVNGGIPDDVILSDYPGRNY